MLVLLSNYPMLSPW